MNKKGALPKKRALVQGQGLGDWPCTTLIGQPEVFFNQTFNYDVWLTRSNCNAADALGKVRADAFVEAVGRRVLGLTKKMVKPEPEATTKQDRKQAQGAAKKHVQLGAGQTVRVVF